jgi:hypothetical protein
MDAATRVARERRCGSGREEAGRVRGVVEGGGEVIREVNAAERAR